MSSKNFATRAGLGLARQPGLWMLISAGMLVAPFSVGDRPLANRDFVQHLRLGPQYAELPIWSEKPGNFNLAITPLIMNDYSYLDGERAFEADRDVSNLNEGVYPDGVKLLLGTHQRVNDCFLVLKLQGMESEPTDCASLKDNEFNLFNFSRPIVPGIFRAELSSTAHSDKNGVSVYVAKDSEGAMWALAKSSIRFVVPVNVLIASFRSHPNAVTLYAIILLINTLLALNVFRPGRYRWQALAVTQLAGVLILMPFLSGFDETIHIKALQDAIMDTKQFTRPEIEQTRSRMYESARKEMILDGFFEHHNVDILSTNTCPHEILGHCFYNPDSYSLYKMYAAFLSLLDVDWGSARVLANCGRALGLIQVGILALIVSRFSSFGAVPLLSLILIFVGGITNNISSVNNTLPLQLVGLVWLFAFIDLFRLQKPPIAMTLMAIFLSWLLSGIDIGWWMTFPIAVIFALICFVTRMKRKVQLPKPTLVLATSVALSLSALFWLAVILAFHFTKSSSAALNFSRLTYILAHSEFGSPNQILNSIAYNVKSVIGTYIWGHSFFNEAAYILVSVALLLLGMSAFLWLRNESWKMAWLFLAACISLANTHILCVVVASSYYAKFNLIPGAAVQIRHFGPGIISLLLAPALGASYLIGRYEKLTFGICWLWNSFLLNHFYVAVCLGAVWK